MMACGVTLLGLGPWMVRLAGTGSLAATFWRLALAIPALAGAILITEGRPRVDRQFAWPIVAAGCFYGSGMIAFNAAALRTTLCNCALLGNLSSFFLAGVGLVLARRRPPWQVASGLLMALAGLGLLLNRSFSLSARTGGGDLIALLAAMLFTGYFLVVSKVREGISPLMTHLVATTAGALVLAPVAVVQLQPPQHWWALVLLALGGQAVGQGLVVFAMQRLDRVTAGLMILLFPLVSAAIGWVRYGETMRPIELIGALLILVSLPLVQIGIRRA
jgi:drug/metabolite transporter (DMT)-like permease